jgi:hypothetical protein
MRSKKKSTHLVIQSLSFLEKQWNQEQYSACQKGGEHVEFRENHSLVIIFGFIIHHGCSDCNYSTNWKGEYSQTEPPDREMTKGLKIIDFSFSLQF